MLTLRSRPPKLDSKNIFAAFIRNQTLGIISWVAMAFWLALSRFSDIDPTIMAVIAGLIVVVALGFSKAATQYFILWRAQKGLECFIAGISTAKVTALSIGKPSEDGPSHVFDDEELGELVQEISKQAVVAAIGHMHNHMHSLATKVKAAE